MQKGTPKNQFHDKIENLIISSRLGESFGYLKERLLAFSNLKNETEKINQLEKTYRYLLHYLVEGFQDESRDKMIEELKDKLLQINDLILREKIAIDSSDPYSSSLRMIRLKETSLPSLLSAFKETVKADSTPCTKEENQTEIITSDQDDILISKEAARSLNGLFNYVWTMSGNNQEEYSLLADALTDDQFPDIAKSVVVGAILLGNLLYFEPETFNILLEIYDSAKSPSLKARAISSIVILTLLYPKRIARNTTLSSNLRILKENPDFRMQSDMVVQSLARAFDTQRISDKMTKEVIPGLMKLNPEIIDKMRNMASDSEDFLSDGNPDWEEMIENSGIAKKLQDINDMQMEGSDVMMTAFSNLKNFSFFNLISNWFLPFTANHHDLDFLRDNGFSEDLSRMLLVMCDSDIYSFMLSLKGMPQIQREMLIGRIKNQMKEAAEVINPDFKETEETKVKRHINFFIQDLYRFFKLYPQKSYFNDLFSEAVNAVELQEAREILGISMDTLQTMAEFYFKYGYYHQAGEIFELINSIEPGDFTIWEKTGFCMQKLHRFGEAADWYRKAELMNPGNLWLEKKLAVCLRNTGNLHDALEYYRNVMEKDPDNFHLLMSAGQCYLDTGDYSDALAQFYHASYVRPESMDAKRAIAWTELLSGDLIKASAHLQELTVNENSEPSDFLNAGHAALVSGDLKNASRHYLDFIRKSGTNDIRILIEAIKEDRNVLSKLNVSTPTLRLITDKIRYDLLEES